MAADIGSRRVRPEWRSSVRWRVTAGASLVLAVALVVAALASAGLLRRALTFDAETSLVDRADQIESLIAHGQLTSVLDRAGYDLAQAIVVDASGQLVAATASTAGVVSPPDGLSPPPVGAQTTETVRGEAIGGRAGEDHRVVARTVASSVGPMTIYVIGPITTAPRAERYLRNTMLVGFPFLAALAGWLIYWVMGQALAPVNAMRIEVDRIEAADLASRVRAGSSDDEITRLGSTLNRMLDRLEEASTRQQLFAASASHELRSPLSAIRTELEVGLTYPDRADWPRIANDSLTELARLETLARDLRTLTRSTSKNQAIRQPIDLAPLVTAEVTRRHPARNLRYRLDSADAVVNAESDSVMQVVRNLFDNAERHATTEVSVTITCDTSGTRLVVANDGPPIPLAERDEIFEPFTRLDDARTLDGGGSGLGLAIARSIMRGFGGSLRVIDVDRGAAFEASFPRSAQSE